MSAVLLCMSMDNMKAVLIGLLITCGGLLSLLMVNEDPMYSRKGADF
jgi:hypothetical protein